MDDSDGSRSFKDNYRTNLSVFKNLDSDGVCGVQNFGGQRTTRANRKRESIIDFDLDKDRSVYIHNSDNNKSNKNNSNDNNIDKLNININNNNNSNNKQQRESPPQWSTGRPRFLSNGKYFLRQSLYGTVRMNQGTSFPTAFNPKSWPGLESLSRRMEEEGDEEDEEEEKGGECEREEERENRDEGVSLDPEDRVASVNCFHDNYHQVKHNPSYVSDNEEEGEEEDGPEADVARDKKEAPHKCRTGGEEAADLTDSTTSDYDSLSNGSTTGSTRGALDGGECNATCTEDSSPNDVCTDERHETEDENTQRVRRVCPSKAGINVSSNNNSNNNKVNNNSNINGSNVDDNSNIHGAIDDTNSGTRARDVSRTTCQPTPELDSIANGGRCFRQHSPPRQSASGSTRIDQSAPTIDVVMSTSLLPELPISRKDSAHISMGPDSGVQGQGQNLDRSNSDLSVSGPEVTRSEEGEVKVEEKETLTSIRQKARSSTICRRREKLTSRAEEVAKEFRRQRPDIQQGLPGDKQTQVRKILENLNPSSSPSSSSSLDDPHSTNVSSLVRSKSFLDGVQQSVKVERKETQLRLIEGGHHHHHKEDSNGPEEDRIVAEAAAFGGREENGGYGVTFTTVQPALGSTTREFSEIFMNPESFRVEIDNVVCCETISESFQEQVPPLPVPECTSDESSNLKTGSVASSYDVSFDVGLSSSTSSSSSFYRPSLSPASRDFTSKVVLLVRSTIIDMNFSQERKRIFRELMEIFSRELREKEEAAPSGERLVNVDVRDINFDPCRAGGAEKLKLNEEQFAVLCLRMKDLTQAEDSNRSFF